MTMRSYLAELLLTTAPAKRRFVLGRLTVIAAFHRETIYSIGTQYILEEQHFYSYIIF